SKALFEKSLKYIPGGVNSGAQAFPRLGITPLVIDSGKGDTFTDLDGNVFIDYCNSWGVLIHGHANPQIVEKTTERLAKGSTFGIHCHVEEALAETIVELIPSIEKIRMFSSGTEATMTAARLARGYTGRDLIVKFEGCYHGHCDAFLVKAGSGVAQINEDASSKGVPKSFVESTLCLPYNDVEALKELFKQKGEQIACIIVEPIAGNMGVVPASQEFMDTMREVTTNSGALLILDEVITGFRVALKGAQSLYNVTPDLTCFGKIIGGGFPVAAACGRADIMDLLPPLGQVYQAGTLSGNPVAMVAGKTAIDLLFQENFYQDLQDKADFLLAPIEKAIADENLPAHINRIGSMFTIFLDKSSITSFESFDEDLFRTFFIDLLEQGIYLSPSPYETSFISSAHTYAHLEKTRAAILSALRSLAPSLQI
ncbi:MAG: glutamate-1-semialdehyde 2,1-aminomutase, partial [Simkaniaceae bacterium]|nr:glutamate-1-semialdehyde 2,1-aminomutase [Simkaniaceae bacterium]